MHPLYLIGVMFLLGLLSASLGVHWALKLSSASPQRHPPPMLIALVIILASLLIYPAVFPALWFEFHVVAKGNPGAQAGVLAMVIAMSCCALAGMGATLVLRGRFPHRE